MTNGQEVWMGNTSIEPPDSPASFAGALGAVRAAVTALAGTGVLPAGSAGALVSYADTAETVQPLGALTTRAAAVGTERTYHRRLGSVLLDGSGIGVDLLARSPQRRRVLLVLGDGNDNTGDDLIRSRRIAELRARAAPAGVVITGVVRKGALSNEDVSQIEALTSRLHTVAAVAEWPAQALQVVADAITVHAVTFDGRTLGPDRTWWWMQLGAGVARVLASAGLRWRRAAGERRGG